jgi:type VI secretion system protein VasJ
MDLTPLGKTPIREDDPCGIDMRYDPEFESLQAEIDKLTSPTSSGQVDWARVAESATHILHARSKDLTVASYLAVALVCTRQIPGLDQGVHILKEMLETFWDNLYPPKKRMRGRAGAITWWLERTETELQKLNPAPMPAEMAERLAGNLKAIDALLAEKMPDAPLLRSLQRRIEALPVEKTKAPAPEKAVADAPAAPAAAPAREVPEPAGGRSPASEPSAGVDAGGGAIDSEAEARRAADAAMQRLRQVSLFLLGQELKHPLAYRYRRIASWAKVTALPVNAEGATQIGPPPPQVVTQLDTLRAEGNWPALIHNAEQKLSQFIFWFDLNRYVAEALNDLGGDHQAALAVVCQETAGLLQRLPGLATLRFSDGMPFADPQTRQWLKQIGGAGKAAPAVGTDTADADPFDATVRKAGAMARKKNYIEAIDLLQLEMQRSPSQHRRMRWRMAIARLLLESKKSQLALPHLEQILADIDRFELDTWDPALAVEGMTLAWQGFSAQAANEHKARAAEVLHRMAKVDPTAALRAAQ